MTFSHKLQKAGRQAANSRESSRGKQPQTSSRDFFAMTSNNDNDQTALLISSPANPDGTPVDGAAPAETDEVHSSTQSR